MDVLGILFFPLLSFRKLMLVETANKESSKDKICHPQDSIGDGIFILGQQIKEKPTQEWLKWLEWLEFENGPLQLKEEIHVGNHHPWKASSQCSGSCVSLVVCLLFYETKQLGFFEGSLPGFILEQQTACLQRSAAIGLTVEFACLHETDHVFPAIFPHGER